MVDQTNAPAREEPYRGTAIWDAAARTIFVTCDSADSGVPAPLVIDYGSPIDVYLGHALARAGWNFTTPGDLSRFRAGNPVQVDHHPHPAGQEEQLAEWVAQYGHHRASAHPIPGGRIQYLVITDPASMRDEDDGLALEAADPNGMLFARASWPGTGGTLADLIGR
jgi:hypothetical protein